MLVSDSLNVSGTPHRGFLADLRVENPRACEVSLPLISEEVIIHF